jgi:RNA polymerase sigma-70 factor, ECF subfamily
MSLVDMQREEDQALMLKVQGGDTAAFEALFARYSGPLGSFFFRLTWDRAFAEDLVQDTFLRVWNGRFGYRPKGKFTTWLFQIGKNHWLNEVEKRRRRIAPASLEAMGDPEGNGRREQVPAPGRGPAEQAVDRELSRTIAAAVNGLSKKLRVVFVLGQLEGMKYADIAEILGIPEGTVKSRMSNAERALRGRLSGHLSLVNDDE